MDIQLSSATQSELIIDLNESELERQLIAGARVLFLSLQMEKILISDAILLEKMPWDHAP